MPALFIRSETTQRHLMKNKMRKTQRSPNKHKIKEKVKRRKKMKKDHSLSMNNNDLSVLKINKFINFSDSAY